MVLCIECALSGGYHNVTSMRVIHAYRIYVFFLQAHILLCLLMMMAYHYFTFSFSLSHLTKKNKRFAHISKDNLLCIHELNVKHNPSNEMNNI